jgi:response regulator RpfG family c-di-GMP phosphodiesterase
MKRKFYIHYAMTMVATLLALALIVCYTFGSFYSIAREDAVTIGQNSVSENAEELTNFLLKGLDVMEVTGLVIDYMMQNDADSEEIKQFLLEESDQYKENIDQGFTGIYGVFRGEYLDGIGWVPDDDYVPEDRPWYKAAIKGGGDPIIVSPYLDAQTNTIMISVSQLLSDGESVVSLDIAMDEIQSMTEQDEVQDYGYDFILDNSGMVVAHSDSSEKGKNYLSEEYEGTEKEYLVKSIYDAQGEAFEISLDNQKYMVFSQIVQDDWYVVMLVNENDLFQKVQSNLLRNILISLLIFALVLYFCTSSQRNRRRSLELVEELKEYQETLEERVLEKTAENEAQNRQMLKMQQNVIDGMATLIESRDGNTGTHVKNSKQYVSFIAQQMRNERVFPEVVDDKFVEDVTSAAALHDVGKIKIPDKILNKPGRFTPEEFEIMKLHSQYGGEIVEEILGKDADDRLIEISRNVARHHHEKWDGTGYPDGLKGEEIPLCARIMAVADVFDALVAKRVYKERMDKEEAYEILRKDTGKHFDPAVIQAFFATRDKIEKYLDSISD